MLKRRRGLIKTQEDDLLEKEALIESGRIMGFERGHEEGLERGRGEGIQVGESKKEAETVYKMYKKGFSEEDISDTLELDIGYIKQILKTS